MLCVLQTLLLFHPSRSLIISLRVSFVILAGLVDFNCCCLWFPFAKHENTLSPTNVASHAPGAESNTRISMISFIMPPFHFDRPPICPSPQDSFPPICFAWVGTGELNHWFLWVNGKPPPNHRASRPFEAEIPQAIPNQLKLAQTIPNQPKPSQTIPNHSKPTQTIPNHSKPTKTHPSHACSSCLLQAQVPGSPKPAPRRHALLGTFGSVQSESTGDLLVFVTLPPIDNLTS